METARQRKCCFVIFLLAISLFLSSGCSTVTGGIKEQTPLTTSLNKYQKLAVEWSSDAPASEETISLFSGLVIEKIRKKNIFQRVFSIESSPKEEFDLKLVLNISHVDEVTDWDQAMKPSPLLMPAEMVVKFELIDEKQSTLLSSGIASAEIRGPYEDKITIINNAAHQLANYIAKNK